MKNDFYASSSQATSEMEMEKFSKILITHFDHLQILRIQPPPQMTVNSFKHILTGLSKLRELHLDFRLVRQERQFCQTVIQCKSHDKTLTFLSISFRSDIGTLALEVMLEMTHVQSLVWHKDRHCHESIVFEGSDEVFARYKDKIV